MKKIYSFMLMATMLLIGINVNAADQSVSSEEALQAAFVQAENGDVITVSTDFSISSTVKIVLPKTTKVTLDLAGNTLSANGTINELFYLYRGDLTVISSTGIGVIQHTTESSTGKNPAVFKVFGTMAKEANYTHLTIEENVTLKVTSTRKYTSGTNAGKYIDKGYGITINERYAVEINNETLPRTSFLSNSAPGFANGIVIDVKGRIEMLCGKGYCVKVNGNIQFAGSKVGKGEFGDGVNTYTVTQADSAEWVAVAPYVKLHSTSYLTATANATGVGAIYCAGYGKWDIQGYADGSCALAIKSGEVNVTDATLKSTATSYEEPANAKSGLDAQGSAILVLTTSNTTYAGEIQVQISGDTKVEAKAGYALEEIVTIPTTSSDVHTNVETINIQGGSFVGGADQGVVAFDVVTLTEKVDAYTIGGGSYTAQTEAQQTAAQTLLETLLGNQTPSDPAYTIEVNNGGISQTGTSIVISPTVIPAPITTMFTFSDLQTAESAGQDVNLEKAQVDGGQLVIAENIELQNLYMNCENPLSIIIPNGITMTAKRIVMGNNDNITIKAGGRLIIDGDQGLYNVKNENLLIEAEEGNMGLFIWKPTVASNRHPHATVQLISKAHGSTIAQRFGIPAYNGIKIADIVKVGHNYGTVYKYWDNASDDWATIQTPQYILEPFRGYNMLIPSASSGNNRYALPCEELYGNVNAEMNFAADHGWNYFSNSYTGEINIKELLLQWRDLGKCEVAVQFNLSSTSNDWEGISLLDIDDLDQNIPGIYLPISKIAPMQCFITRTKENEEAFKDNLDYEALVWNHKDEANEPIGTPQAAPARRNMAQVSDYTKAIVVIANGENEQRVTLRQGSQFSEEFDNGAEMSCFKNGNINLFATTEYGDMAQVATDNLIGQTLSVESAKAASFKMTFTGLYGEQLAIRDNMTGSVIDMTEGEEYFFSVAPGTTADRFEIVEAAKMPTDVEAIKAAPAKKGIYTLVGQYLGEDFEALPAGIYVVNGKKVVK